ncbi:MAG: hypothetical protein H0Z29_10805 [Candidatus Marinimicrobia bacterium]|nr:hypothetical protein [Candidatus Neomarinimicrobiota bacterium]
MNWIKRIIDFHHGPQLKEIKVEQAVRKAGITRHAGYNTFRCSSVTHILKAGCDVKMV